MEAQEIIRKADAGEGLTVEEIKIYREAVKPVKHVYGKYGTLKRKYLEEKGIDWTIADLPTYLHGVDKQADELEETMRAKLARDERFTRTGNYIEDCRRLNEMQRLIEEEILHEIVYVA
ncbi:TnpV protein [Pumilibacter intestinalis]|uniref:TnpV protein n=1 Tax=Pumilibacter intestinalis TaxID=2941511 RepID=UPI0020411FFD|nr:TnpV protein [Pumilibacter intestinalis]